MHHINRQSIKFKLSAILFGSAVIPALIIGSISYFFARNLSYRHALDVGTIADQANKQLMDAFESAAVQINSLSKQTLFSDVSLSTPGEDFATISSSLKEYLNSHRQHSFLVVSDNEGNIIGATDRQLIGKTVPEIEAYTKALESGHAQQSPIVEESLSGVREHGFWTIVPLYPAWGADSPIGALAAFNSFATLAQVLEKTKIDGQTQDADRHFQVIDLKTGKNIYTPGSAELKRFSTPNLSSILLSHESFLKSAGSISFQHDSQVIGFAKAETFGIAVLCVVEEQIVYRQISSLYRFLIFALAGVAVFILLIAIPFSRIFTKPIFKLKENALELAGGNLDSDINDTRKDEIGDLARSFSSMRTSIKRRISELRDLNAAAEQLPTLNSEETIYSNVLDLMLKKTGHDRGGVIISRPGSEPALIGLSAEEYHRLVPFSQKMILDHAKESNQIRRLHIQTRSEKDLNLLLCIPISDGRDTPGCFILLGKETQNPEAFNSEFFSTLARLAMVNIKNVSMLNIIEEQNRNLETKVLERTRQLEQKTRDVQSMLQNMKQGIFTILDNNLIHPEYSTYLESILRTQKIAHTDVTDLLLKNSSLTPDQIQQIRSVLINSIHENIISFRCNQYHLPREIIKNFNGEKSILECDWEPICDSSDTVEKIMVIVRDVTQLKALELQSLDSKRELEITNQILNNSSRAFEIFMTSCISYTKSTLTLLNQENGTDGSLLEIMRNIHTIKGNSRAMGFHELANIAHLVEEALMDKEDSPGVRQSMDRLESCLYKYREIYQEKLASKITASSKETGLLKDIVKIIDELPDSQTNEHGGEAFKRIAQLIQQSQSISLPDLLQEATSHISELADVLGKAIPEVRFKNQGDLHFLPHRAHFIIDVMNHLLRNSIDHGIETSDLRMKLGKPAHGGIEIETRLENAQVLMKYRDDGAGLNISKIREVGLCKGLITEATLDHDQIVGLIFEPRFSTASSVTSISGRGVGMDAVKAMLMEQGGSISINFLDQDNGSGFRQFEFLIRMPGDIVSQTVKAKTDPLAA